MYVGQNGQRRDRALPASDRRLTHRMLSGKSITFDEEELSPTAAAPAVHSAAGVEFLERLRAGDAVAFDILITRHSGEIYGLLYRLTSDPDEAAELTQETFMQAVRAIKGFRGDADLKTWLFRIAVNQSRNRFRWWKRRKRESTYSLEVSARGSEKTYSEILADNRENPEAAVLRMEREAGLRRALKELAPAFREAIVLRDIEGLSYEEVAAALNVNIGTVKSRIARGREELRRQLVDF